MISLKDKKGTWPIAFLLPFIVTTSIVALGTVRTTLDGTMANNAKVISCKITNQGENYCNEKYGYTPKKVVTVAKSGGN